jgi:hypothetical protein
VPARPGGLADDPHWLVGRRPDQQDPAVLDVRGEQRAAGQQHRVVRVGQVVRARARLAGHAVAVLDPVRGDVDHADDRIVLLGGHDLPAVRREERVVRDQEGLPAGQVAGGREPPPDPALRVHDEQPVVAVVGDQHVAGQRPRI